MKRTSLHALILILILCSCESVSPIEGLWVVRSVEVGDQEMTPNARWTRFNADQTQESGNGRFQHSYGTWQWDQTSKELVIENTNGLKDQNGPFVISIDQNQMVWERTEEGEEIKVKLERASKLPETYGDRVLGLWKLKKAVGDGRYFKESDQEEDGSFLFLRWDRRFVINSQNGRINGVYNVHGHRPELELIPYGDPMERDFWDIKFAEDQITLQRLNSDTVVERTFRRIDQFPE